jgi:hypothetical protein
VSVPGNAVQQLGLVPFDTEALANNGKFTWGWGQWFLGVYNVAKTVPFPTNNVPANPALIVGWQQVSINGQTFYMPLYQ